MILGLRLAVDSILDRGDHLIVSAREMLLSFSVVAVCVKF